MNKNISDFLYFFDKMGFGFKLKSNDNTSFLQYNIKTGVSIKIFGNRFNNGSDIRLGIRLDGGDFPKKLVVFNIKKGYKLSDDSNEKILLIPAFKIGDATSQGSDKFDVERKVLKDDYLQINKKNIHYRNWMFPFIEFEELCFPHQKSDDVSFSIFDPLCKSNKYIITVPIEIKTSNRGGSKLDQNDRKRLYDEVSIILDYIAIVYCIAYGVSCLINEYLNYINSKLFNPRHYNLGKKFKDYHLIKEFPLVNLKSSKIIYCNLSYHFEFTSRYNLSLNSEIFIESSEKFLNMISAEYLKNEEQISRLISMHTSMIAITISLAGILLTQLSKFVSLSDIYSFFTKLINFINVLGN
jgi:hypothetical protein